MRDRFDLSFQLLADPDGEVAEQYSGTEQTAHGRTGVAGTYLVDTDGAVRYEHVGDNVTDRTYGNHVRYILRDDFGARYEEPFGAN